MLAHTMKRFFSPNLKNCILKKHVLGHIPSFFMKITFIIHGKKALYVLFHVVYTNFARARNVMTKERKPIIYVQSLTESCKAVC
jgi:hypothetical protein